MQPYPRFHLYSVTSPQQEKPSLQMKFVTPSNAHEGIQLAQKAVDVLQPSFVMGIIGSAGSGKSSLIQQFLLNPDFFGKKYQRVLFIGPTFYKNLIQDTGNTNKKLDVNWIYDQIGKANSWKCKSMLVIFDDIVSSMSKYNSPDFYDLFYNRRHLLNDGVISFIITSQKWNLVPTFIRSAYTGLVIFGVVKQQQQLVYKQVTMSIPKRTFQQLMAGLKTHQFLYLNHQNSKIFDHLWRQL